MRDFLIVCGFCFGLLTSSIAQKFFTKTGHISFSSETPIEKITAHNKSSQFVLDIATGKLELGVLIKGFQFEKALMQEHFNENYMESSTYPKAIFKGQIANYTRINPSKNGKTKVKVIGDLTIHGVTKSIVVDAWIHIVNGKIDADAIFNVKIADYNIAIPSIVKENISEKVEVMVDVTLELLKL